MKIEALERALVSLLRTELTSEKTQVGQTKEWIYVDYPRLDATMPRISLTLTGSVQTPLGIGAEMGVSNTLGVRETTTFDIDVFVHRTNRTTGISPTRAGTSLRDYLGDQIIDVLLKKRGYLTSTYGIEDIVILAQIPQPYDEETELFRKIITIQVTHIREY